MNISLTKELEDMVTTSVDSGRYHSASEVVREGLRLFEEQYLARQARLQQLERDIQIGIDQLDRGEGTKYNETTLNQFFENIKIEGRKRLAKQSK